MLRLATQLTRVQPEVRARFADLAAGLAKKSAMAAAAESSAEGEIASQPSERSQR